MMNNKENQDAVGRTAPEPAPETTQEPVQEFETDLFSDLVLSEEDYDPADFIVEDVYGGPIPDDSFIEDDSHPDNDYISGDDLILDGFEEYISGNEDK